MHKNSKAKMHRKFQTIKGAHLKHFYVPGIALFSSCMLLGTNDVMARLVLVRGILNLRPEGRGENSEKSGWDGSSSILRARLMVYCSVRVVMFFISDPVIFLPILVTLSSMFLFWTERAPPQHWMAKVTTL